MANPQYWQSSYVPAVQYKPQGSAKAVLVPDWLGASYIDLADKITRYEFYVIQEQDLCQPDGIAHKVYGNSNWWWVICDFNAIINPFTDMVVGNRIKIPDLNEVSLYLQKKSTTGVTVSNVVDKRGTFVTI